METKLTFKKKLPMLGEKVGTFTGTTTDKVMPAQGGLLSFKTSAQN